MMERRAAVLENRSGGGERTSGPGDGGVAARAANTLSRLEMPPEEIRAVLEAYDPETVRRYLELHRERLEERLAERRRTLALLERSLVEAAAGRGER